MESAILRILPVLQPLRATRSVKKDITDAPSVPRTLIGPAAEHLQNELLKMYWIGVQRELPYILLTLRRWQSCEDMAGLLPDEKDNHIHGFDTFLDQVSYTSRQHFERNFQTWPPTKKEKEPEPSHERILQNIGWDMFTEMKSLFIKETIHDSLANRQPIEPLKRRARMLLQSAQFLDIDKIVEYREPEESLSFWKRPAPAQMAVSSYDERGFPIFVPQQCVECNAVIRGAVFSHIEDEDSMICESCYRKNHFDQLGYFKNYKQSCLSTAVDLERSQELCSCCGINRTDSDGRLRSLWPIDLDDNHQSASGNTGPVGKIRKKKDTGLLPCGLCTITDRFAEAKYATTQFKLGKNKPLRRGNKEQLKRTPSPERFKRFEQPTIPEFGTSHGYTDKSPEKIAPYLRSTTNKYPYGNVHMALRIGPIIIENGVANTHGGVLITSRDPPSLQVLRDPPDDIKNCLLLVGRQDRTLYSQVRPRSPKRYKCFMKQVVGGAFCSFFDHDNEMDVINALIEESNRLIEDGISFDDKEKLLKQGTDRLIVKLKDYLGPRVEAYISSITAQLLDPETELRWNFRSNNCQMFCDSLINRNTFGPFLRAKVPTADSTNDPAPLYLMSFVCRPEAYTAAVMRSKYDVPNGLTEEYLLRFRYGRHDESDIIDTLAEYWYDWGGFEGPLYPYQDVFPWDCTEAYDGYPGKCGQCNISKHVWAFPFDSWSIISLHLAKGRQFYPRDAFPHEATRAAKGQTTGQMTDTEWFRNRLTVLLGQDVLLAAAVALAQCDAFRESTLWLHQQEDEKLDRLKLGGIHRAQPFSHHFEKGAYHHYFVADWACLTRPCRIAKYEDLRDWRATRHDVGRRSIDSGGCGNDVIGCGPGGGCGNGTNPSGESNMEGCAGSEPDRCHDACGTGCVSKCSSCAACGGCGDG